MSEVKVTLLGVAVGGIIGFISSYFANRQARATALEAIKTTEFNKAAAVFYEAFHDTLMDIENQNLTMDDTDSLIRKNIERQISAVQRFKFQLGKKERIAFLAAWEAYEYDCRASKFADLQPGDRFRREKQRNHALHHLYKILKFADYERDSPVDENSE